MKPLTSLLVHSFQRLWQAAATKYVLVLLVAGVYMLFFDRYNLRSQQRVQKQIEDLKADKVHYQRAINALTYEAEQISSDPETLERFARERYHMKRPNEDVFVITEAEE